jgi:hypothetical protein
MAGCNPLSFVPFNKGVDKRSGGQVSAWVRSLWRTKKDVEFGGFCLKTITKDNMFKLQDLQAVRLWMLPPAAMEVAVELLCKDWLAQPQWPHVFAVPRLMTRFWRKDLMKSADLYFTVPAGVPFWAASQFKPLIVAVILPLSQVASHTGLWMIKGTPEGEQTEQALRQGFKGGDPNDPGKLHELEGVVCDVWEDPKGGHALFCSNDLLGQATFPLCRMSGAGMLSGSKQRPFPQA